ncbi:MAG: peptidoglycan-binding protein [Planctomycetes bacterium]|nr:peptidoglycan-binding protein [Planctomycetota bacterium]
MTSLKNNKQLDTVVSVSAIFNVDLYLGIRHADVKRLQQLLNSDPDTCLVKDGVGSPGNETDYFGSLTEKAVKKFQKKYGIVSSGAPQTTGYGCVGRKTRAKLVEVFRNKEVKRIEVVIPETRISDIHPVKLENMKYYGPDSIETKVIRDYINDEFHLRKGRNDLQCTEYAYYKLLCAGIRVEWTRTTNRHGGLWPEVVSTKYKILDTPVKGRVICLPLSVIPYTGHVAYIERVNPDQSIDISEANWGPNSVDIGRYWERTLSLDKWKNRYRAKFIDFRV